MTRVFRLLEWLRCWRRSLNLWINSFSDPVSAILHEGLEVYSWSNRILTDCSLKSWAQVKAEFGWTAKQTIFLQLEHWVKIWIPCSHFWCRQSSPRNPYRLSDINLRIRNYSLHAITRQPCTKAHAVLGESSRPTASSITENANLFTDKTFFSKYRVAHTHLANNKPCFSSARLHKINQRIPWGWWQCAVPQGTYVLGSLQSKDCGQIKTMSREGQKLM